MRGRWCNVIVLNVRAPSEKKNVVSEVSFYEELEQFPPPKYHMKVVLGDFNAKVGGGENIYKPTVMNESLHQDSNDNGIRIVNIATSKNLVVEEYDVPAPKHS